MPADETIPAVLARRHLDDADVQALVNDDRCVTYAVLDDESLAVAMRLVAAGVNKGDRVGLLMPNGILWATTALAVMRIGAVLVPLSTLLRPPELLAQLDTAAVTHLVCVRNYRSRAYLDDLENGAPGLRARANAGGRHPSLPSLRHVWADDELPEEAAPGPFVEALEHMVHPADDMAILFTSGSRGAPKGVVHTHGNAIRATVAGLDVRCVSAGERLYIPMPFFWMGGFGGGLLTALVAGATLLTESDPEPARTIEFLERERVTLFRGWPDQGARIASHPAFATADLSSLRPGSLAAVLPAGQRPAPGARANLFGMTESFGPYCGDRLDADMPASKWGSCGRPFEGIDVRVADPETCGDVPAGAEGEIQLRGPNMMRSICGRTRDELFTADGYYRTRDLGRIDDDGYLWYVGRLDDMFKVNGATVYPTEVEAALRSISGVAEAFVTNLRADDGRDRVGALVVSGADVGDLVGALRERISSFKMPTVWLVVPDPSVVPMSASGKVDKSQLQQLLVDRGGRPMSSGSLG